MGFLDGLTTLLGGFSDVKQIDKEGFDFREKRAQDQFERDKAREQYGTSLAADYLTAAEEPDFDVAGSAFGPEVDAKRRKLLLGTAAGKAAGSRPMLEAQKAYFRGVQDETKHGYRMEEIGLTAEQAQERDRLRFERQQGRTLSPAEQSKLESYERMSNAQIASAAQGRSESAGRAATSNEFRLRNEFNTQSKAMRTALQDMDRFAAPARTQIAAGQPPTASDQFSLIYAFNKALDPGSVVREGEFANTRGVGAGVTEQAYLLLEKWRSGAQLNPKQVEMMLDTIDRAKAQTQSGLNDTRRRYVDLAGEYGMEPTRIVDELPSEVEAPITRTQAPEQAGKKVGERKVFPNGRVGVWDGKGWVAQ